MHCCQKFSLNQLAGIAAGWYCIWLVLQLVGIAAWCKMSRSAGNGTTSAPLPSFAEFFCRLGKGGIETLRCVQGGWGCSWGFFMTWERERESAIQTWSFNTDGFGNSSIGRELKHSLAEGGSACNSWLDYTKLLSDTITWALGNTLTIQWRNVPPNKITNEKKNRRLSPDQGAHAYQPRPLIPSSDPRDTHVPSHHHHCSQHDHRLWRAFLANVDFEGEWASCCQVIIVSSAQTWQDCTPSAPFSHPQMHARVRGSETRSTRATISWRVFLTNFAADNLEYGCCCQLITESPAKTWHQPDATWSTQLQLSRDSRN